MASKNSTTKKSKSFTVKPLPELAKNPLIFEILDLASRQRAKTKKLSEIKTQTTDRAFKVAGVGH